jgi:hypothetical protein
MADTKPIQIKSIFDNSEFPSPEEIDLEQYYEVEIEFEDVNGTEVQVAWTFYFMKAEGVVAYRVGKEKCEPAVLTNGSDNSTGTDTQINKKDEEISKLKTEVERLNQELTNKQTTGTVSSGIIGNVMNTVIPKISLQPTIDSLNTQSAEYKKLNNELKSLIDQLKPGQITEQLSEQLSVKLTEILQQNTKSMENNNKTVDELKTAKATIIQLEAAIQANEQKCKNELEAALKAKQEAALKAKQEADEKAKLEAEAEKARLAEAEKAKLEAEKAKQEAEKAKQEAALKAKLEAEKAKQEAEKAKQEAEKAKADAAAEQAKTLEKTTTVSQPEPPKKPNISLENMTKHQFLDNIKVDKLDNTLITPINEWIEYLRTESADTTNIDQIDKSSSPFKEILLKLETLKKLEKNKDNLTKLASVTDWISKFNNKTPSSRKTFNEFKQQLSFELEKQKLTTDFGATRTRAKYDIENTYNSYINNLNSQKIKIEADLKVEGAKKTNKVNNKPNEEYIKILRTQLTNIEQLISENDKLLLKKNEILKGINDLDPVPTSSKSKTQFGDQITAYKKGINTIKQLKQDFDEFYNKLTTSDVYKNIFNVKLNNTISKKRGGFSRKAKPRKSKSITFRAYS